MHLLTYSSFRLQNKLLLSTLLRCFNKSHARTYSGLLILTPRKGYLFEETTGYSCCWHIRIFHQSHGMASKTDLYEVLGVSRNASQHEIKSAYFRLAKMYHPDINVNDPEAAKKFQEVYAAYQVLGDETKREEYAQQEFSDSESIDEIHVRKLYRKIFVDSDQDGTIYKDIQKKFRKIQLQMFALKKNMQEKAFNVDTSLLTQVHELLQEQEQLQDMIYKYNNERREEKFFLKQAVEILVKSIKMRKIRIRFIIALCLFAMGVMVFF